MSVSTRAQKYYSFNSPGSSCYFHYICYAQNQNYVNTKRPFVFVFGKPGENATYLYEQDTLKNQARFYDYEFVYIPGSEGNAVTGLECVKAVSSMLTYNYAQGSRNVFLQITNPAISEKEVRQYGLSPFFKTIRFSDKAMSNDTLIALGSVTEDFKETAMLQEEGDYVEDESSGNSEPEQSHKTYFGSPKKYNLTVSGIVKDRQSGEALPFAIVQVKGTSKGVTANMDGYFTLVKVPCDTSVLIVQYVGYQKIEVFLDPDIVKKNLIVQLAVTNNLKEVLITTTREDVVLVSQTDISTIKMTPKKLEQLPNIGERDVMRSFQLMPGISASNESSSGLYVRGGTPDQNLILYDGFTIY